MKLNLYLKKEIKLLEKDLMLRSMREVEGAQGRYVNVNGKRVLNFCSNNYLGLANDPRLRQAAANCIDTEGVGSGASRLVCGNMSAHRRLEEDIADFKGVEACLVFSSGYMANVGIISSIYGKGDMIFCDRLNHASIIDGILLSGAQFKRYFHNDMVALEQMLQKFEGKVTGKKLIVTDSVFSMDGDIAPLDEIVGLAERYDCSVMVDEAHAFGVMGENGRGLVEHFGLEGSVDIQMGTLSKAAGSFGAYCCGSRELIEYLVNKARSFIYTTGMPPSVAAASSEAIEIIKKDVSLREKLWSNTSLMRSRLLQTGFDTMDSKTPIIPILIKDAGLALDLSARMFESGVMVSAIRPPTVPVNTERLRLTVTAEQTEEDINFVVDQLIKIGKEICLL